jgi:tetratricopeptide (TPR) repeat protein
MPQYLSALDYSDVNSTLSDVFSSLIDDNEGTTTFRSLNIPTGGRAESMGTAYTGLSDDISFFEYNPAASSVMKNTEFAAFHNAWIADSAMETIAGTIRSGNLGLGGQLKCFYVPFSEYNLYGERVSGSYYSETSATANISYNWLAGYKFKGLATGLNIRASWRSIPDYTDNDTNAIISGSGLAQSGLGLMADAGIMMQFNAAKFYTDRNANVRFGLSINNTGVSLTGFGSASGVQLDDPLPTKISAGISYRPIASVVFSADFRQPVNLQNISASGKWSAGTGFDVQVTSFFAVLGGFLIQGGNPRISLGSEFEIKGVKMDVNYTFDLTSSANPVNHISFAAKLNFGDRGRADLQKQVDNYYTAGLLFYAAGDLDSAIETWKKALAIDKHFDPAIDGIRAAENSQALYRHIIDIQNLD